MLEQKPKVMLDITKKYMLLNGVCHQLFRISLRLPGCLSFPFICLFLIVPQIFKWIKILRMLAKEYGKTSLNAGKKPVSKNIVSVHATVIILKKIVCSSVDFDKDDKSKVISVRSKFKSILADLITSTTDKIFMGNIHRSLRTHLVLVPNLEHVLMKSFIYPNMHCVSGIIGVEAKTR